MNKAKRVLEHMKEKDANKIENKIGEIAENATPLKQARYINDTLNAAEKMNICRNYCVIDEKG